PTDDLAAVLAYRSLLSDAAITALRHHMIEHWFRVFLCRNMPVPQAGSSGPLSAGYGNFQGRNALGRLTQTLPVAISSDAGTASTLLSIPLGRFPFSEWASCSAASNVAADVRRHKLPVLKGGFCVSTVSIVCGRAPGSVAVVAGCI